MPVTQIEGRTHRHFIHISIEPIRTFLWQPKRIQQNRLGVFRKKGNEPSILAGAKQDGPALVATPIARLRLGKLLYLELPRTGPRSPNGFFNQFLIQVAASLPKRPVMIRTVSEVKRLRIYSGYMQWPFPNGHKT
jgi:hypothetical protein